jgi:hypothetical protein
MVWIGWEGSERRTVSAMVASLSPARRLVVGSSRVSRDVGSEVAARWS